MGGVIRQTNFRAGELSPFLWGRTDLPLFGAGARRLRNFAVTKSGAAMSRPGTTFTANAKYFEAPALGDRDEGQARLIPFSAGDGDFESYALQFGRNYIRFICNNAEVLDGGGNVYEVTTPYSATDIWQLQYAQLGDVLVLVCPNHDPLELRREGHINWTLTKVRFKSYAPVGLDIGSDPVDYTTAFLAVVPDPWQVSKGYEVGDLVTNDGNTYECTVAGSSTGGGAGPTGTGQAIVNGGVTWRFVSLKYEPDETHPLRRWQWVWTAVVKDKETGVLYETLAEPVVEFFNGNNTDEGGGPINGDLWALYPDMPIRLRRAPDLAPPSFPDGYDTYEVQEYLLYRGDGGLFGFIASTKSREFIDVGDAPDYAIQPPIGTEPFGEETEASGAPAPFDTRRLKRPTAVAFFQQRLMFGFENEVYASKKNDFLNWDLRVYQDVKGEALRYALAFRKKESLKSFGVLGRYLMSLTDASVWSVAGTQGSSLDFDSVDADVEDEVGARTLAPLVVDGSLLFARAKGRGARALVPTGQQKAFAGVDVSESSHHLFSGKDKQLVDWCFQEDPFGLVWAVRSDGQLLSLTYERERWGWTRHDTDGLVESVCSIPEGDEDAVYLVVVREIAGGPRRYIERMTSRVLKGGAVVNAEPAVEVPPDDICLDSALEYFGPGGVGTITGLEHLEGKEVWVLVQGLDPIGPLPVAGGEVELGEDLDTNVETPLGPKLLLHVGLKFTPELETLDVGAEKLRQKTVAKAGFEVDQARGLVGGMDFDHLMPWQQRDLSDGYAPVSNATALVYMDVEAEWNQSARLALRQELPLPITVVGISRELEGGD